MHRVELSEDHPGFADPEYRARRDAIARNKKPYGVEYTAGEHALWSSLSAELAPLHADLACREIAEVSASLPLPRDRIPQLEEVSALIRPRTGFVLEPVEGLVPSRVFLGALARGVFLSTQYIRHASRPHYTPEPDVIHELWGHAASLAHPDVAALNRVIGVASLEASDEMITCLERFYWYSLEFGLVLEGGAPKAFGAGLLSSVAEIKGFRTRPRLRPHSVEAVVATPYQTDYMQDELFAAPSLKELGESFSAWLDDRRATRRASGAF